MSGRLATIAVLALHCAAVGAATCTWTGAGPDANWSTIPNWSNCAGSHPFDGDAITLPAGAARLANNNDLAKLSVDQLTVSDGYTVSGNSIALTHGLTANSASGAPELQIGIVLSTNAQVFQCSSGSAGLKLDGVINLNGHALTIASSCNILFNNKIVGAGGINKGGTSTAFFEVAGNTYSGITAINAGTLLVKPGASLGASGDGNGTTVASGATLDLDGATTVDDDLAIAGVGVFTFGALLATGFDNVVNGAITVNAASTINTPGGTSLTLNGPINGDFTLTKTGSGKLIQNSASTAHYSLHAGTLEIDGSVDSVDVLPPATLAGVGSSNTDIEVTAGGILAPGRAQTNRPGTFTAFFVNWLAGGIMQFQLGAADATSDHLTVGGLSRSGSGVFEFDFSDAASPPTPGVTYELVDFSLQSGFALSDFSFVYTGTGLGASMDGSFGLTSTAVTFTPSVVVSDLIFRDRFE